MNKTVSTKNTKAILIFLSFDASLLFNSLMLNCDFFNFSSYIVYTELVSFRCVAVFNIPVFMLVILSRDECNMFLVYCKCELTDFKDFIASEGSA